MAAVRCLTASGATIGVANVAGRERVVVTLQSEGVSCYSTSTQRVVRTWALGDDRHEFTAPAVFDPASRRYFAALASPSPAAADSVLLSWAHSAEGGALWKVSTQLRLPSAVAAVLPLATSRGVRHPGGDAMDVDAAEQPAVLAVHADGAVSLCSAEAVLATSAEAAGQPLLAACMDGGALRTLHLGRSSADAEVTLGSFTVIGSSLRCESLLRLAPPPGTARALGATCAAGRAAVLWSDGSFAAYDIVAGNAAASPVLPALVRRLRGFALPAAPPAKNGKTPARGGKKRTHADAAGGAAGGGVALASVGAGLVAIAGWASTGSALRLVGIDVEYGGIHAAVDVDAAGIGSSSIAMQGPLQAAAAGVGYGRVALSAGGCALVAQFDAELPSLASLVGALDIGAAPAAAPSLQSNNLAHAARLALHEDDLAALTAPGAGAGGGPLRYHLAAADADASELLAPVALTWTQPGAEGMAAAEAEACAAMAASGAAKKGRSEAQFLSLLRPLLHQARELRAPLSRGLLASLLASAADCGHWKGVEELLLAQHPGSLAGCAGVAATLAGGRQYRLLHLLLRGATDLPGDDVAAVLRALLAPADAAAKRAQREYRVSIRAAAEAAVAAAEAAGASDQAPALLAAAACAAAAVEGFSAAQVCLHPLLAARHDAAVLLGALRQLPAAHAVALLRYLARWLHNSRQLAGEWHHAAAATLPAIALPSPAAVLEWVGLTVDANLSRLMLRADAADVLGALRADVAPQVAALRRLARTKGAVEHVQCGAPLPAPPAGADVRYTLEWLDLRVA